MVGLSSSNGWIEICALMFGLSAPQNRLYCKRLTIGQTGVKNGVMFDIISSLYSVAFQRYVVRGPIRQERFKCVFQGIGNGLLQSRRRQHRNLKSHNTHKELANKLGVTRAI